MSVREDIIDDVVTTLEGITTGGGYNNTVRQVLRVAKPGVTISRYPAIVVLEMTEEHLHPPGQAPVGLVSQRLQLGLQLWAFENNDRAEVLNSLLADVQKALAVDHTRGGVAIDTRLTSNQLTVDEAGNPLGVNQLAVTVLYRFTRTDPTEAR